MELCLTFIDLKEAFDNVRTEAVIEPRATRVFLLNTSGIQCVERLSKLKRRKRAAWGALRNIEGVVKKAKNMRLDAHLFDTAVLTVPIHASTEGNPEFRAPSSNEDQQCRNYAKESKIRWTGHFMRYSDDCWTRALTEWISRNVKRTLRRP
uniref:Reverse transcriptase domain-containing protein n=1 Tax=Haemonchus contortus TaxID=6289 RepID=A0A7I4Z1G7_HAECO